MEYSNDQITHESVGMVLRSSQKTRHHHPIIAGEAVQFENSNETIDEEGNGAEVAPGELPIVGRQNKLFCKLCTIQGLPTNYQLNKHILSVHMDKCFQCRQCLMVYASALGLKKHAALR
jgi:hypothetical protein